VGRKNSPAKDEDYVDDEVLPFIRSYLSWIPFPASRHGL
jgi:hypothetical protein